jgi:hypothetical protein
MIYALELIDMKKVDHGSGMRAALRCRTAM